MIGWLVNLNMLGGRAPAPPVVAPLPGGGGHRRRGSIWEPRVDLAIEEARRQRELEAPPEELEAPLPEPAAPHTHEAALAELEREAPIERQAYAAVLADLNRGVRHRDQTEEEEALVALARWLASLH